MAGTLATVEVIDADELAALRLAAERYDWLRSHHVRIQGSEVWYAGAALDVRIDVGREHVAQQAKDVTPQKLTSRKRRLN
ncbi:hypothetical protein [Pseudomonas syringae group genomosp. 7]|uniref:hypothetical protein n=1 Tax=Pseudomonas syringae group genomosp. 7 TaxID=251699 RepID=UPI000EFFB20A|nr:hypothetical protein [Pseudomonas syringae group genomosp. 7]RMW17446.1 hypothetical protein ALO98_200084 [Pseudomonas syringae pv. tagetis]